MPLKLSLKPGEKLVINGAVVENGDRRATLVLQNKASVLREKDIMQQADANTPARRIYFPVMMMYLDQGPTGESYNEFALRMTGIHERDSKSRDACRVCRAQPRRDGW
jgi:flagellar protein FlbT